MHNYLLGLLALMGVVFTGFSEAEINRIVSVGGSISEWVVVLDGEDKLVGVDTTSSYPSQLNTLPKVGYQRQLSAEGIASLKPDLLLGSKEMGPSSALEQIKNMGIEIKILSTKADLDTVKKNVVEIGSLLGKEQLAQSVFTDYQTKLEAQTAEINRAQKTQAKPNVLLVVGFSDSLLAAGKNTTGDWLIEQAGGTNVVKFDSYKVVANESLVALAPDIIVIANTGKVTDKELIANLIKNNASLKLTTAVQKNKLMTIDASLLVAGLGPRIPAAVEKLAKVFYQLADE